MKYGLNYSRLGNFWLHSVLSFLLLLYILRMLSFADIEYYATIHRITDLQTFSGSFTGSFFVDSILILVITFLVIWLIVPTRVYAVYVPAIATAIAITGIYSPSIIEISFLNHTIGSCSPVSV